MNVGSAALTPSRGRLDVSLVDGFDPALGSTFEVLTYGSRSGAFAAAMVSALGLCREHFGPRPSLTPQRMLTFR